MKTTIILFNLFLQLAFPRTFYLPADCNSPLPDYTVRQRCAQMREHTFLNTNGDPKNLTGDGINLNFFMSGAPADFTGYVTSSGYESGMYAWQGYLEGMEYSYFSIIYQGDVWIVHAAHPQGVFETRYLYGDLYRIVELNYDQVEE